jgi:hypothetical protein
MRFINNNGSFIVQDLSLFVVGILACGLIRRYQHLPEWQEAAGSSTLLVLIYQTTQRLTREH